MKRVLLLMGVVLVLLMAGAAWSRPPVPPRPLRPPLPPPASLGHPACPSGQHWSFKLKTCVPNGPGACPQAMHWSRRFKRCVPDKCPPGTHWSLDWGECVPNP